MSQPRMLALALLSVAALYAAWLARGPHALAAALVLVLPPVLLAAAALRGWRRAGFTAGVLALAWFSHGVMLAWAEPAQRLQAGGAVVLSLVVIAVACLPGWRARRDARRG